MIKDVLETISYLGTSILAIGIIITIFQLFVMKKSFYHNHERSRREKAINMILEWIKYTTINGTASKTFVEKLSETECRHIWEGDTFVTDTKFKESLEKKIPEFGKCEIIQEGGKEKMRISGFQSLVLKSRVCEYINLTEMIFAAYYTNVADREILRTEFALLVSEEQNIHFLESFRKVAGGQTAFPCIYKFIEELTKSKVKVPEKEILGQRSSKKHKEIVD